MSKFKLPRKQKKKYKKDAGIFFKCYYYSDRSKEKYEWFYGKEQVIRRNYYKAGIMSEKIFNP